jgi:hypothetical protein
MPRARLSVNGIDIAKPGYDVDTAGLPNMRFSSSMVAARIAATGTVVPTAYDSNYNYSVVNFATAFPTPPIVLVAGIYGDGTSDQTPFLTLSADGSTAWNRPYYEIRTYTDRFELYVCKIALIRTPPSTWRYWVFQNTIET